MSGDRDTEIPVKREPRSFEQRRRDILTGLEQRTQPAQDVAVYRPSGFLSDMFDPVRSSWLSEVNSWVSENNRRWEEEMNRMRRQMFALEPFDFPMETFGTMPSMIDRISRYMQDMRQQMDAEFDRAQSEFPGALLPRVGQTSSLMDMMQDAFEPGEDGKMHFKARFDVKGFKPEEIKVTTKDNRLMVQAEQSHKSEHGSRKREFYKMIDLPQCIDVSKMNSYLTEDNVLELEAPVNDVDYQAITYGKDKQLKVKPHPGPSEVVQSKELTLTGKEGLSVMKDDAGRRKIHLEVPVDPRFTADDISVRMDAHQMKISGQHKSIDTSGECLQEFSRVIELPETMDPFSMKAQLIGGNLVVEAPLRSEPKALDS